MAEVHTDVEYLIQQMAQSVVINNLSFMMSLLHVSASRRSSSRRLHSNEYSYRKFCRTCAYV